MRVERRVWRGHAHKKSDGREMTQKPAFLVMWPQVRHCTIMGTFPLGVPENMEDFAIGVH